VVIERYLQLLRAPRSTVLRMAGLVGGSRKPGRFLAGKKDIPNGEAPVNLVHLDDCIGLIQSLIKQEAFGHTLNVVADGHPTRAAFYTAQAEKEGLEPPTFKGNKELAYKIISNEQAKALLAYTFQHPDPMKF
jgi:nucleoside-diphosphate-sugar epimerase